MSARCTKRIDNARVPYPEHGICEPGGHAVLAVQSWGLFSALTASGCVLGPLPVSDSRQIA